MAMLSLSVSCIHLELSATKSPKEQAPLVRSMILFQGGRKMAELCATRMELDHAFVAFPQLFARACPGFDSVVMLPIRLHIPDDRGRFGVAIGSKPKSVRAMRHQHALARCASARHGGKSDRSALRQQLPLASSRSNFPTPIGEPSR
jgi:hypothetical protein